MAGPPAARAELYSLMSRVTTMWIDPSSPISRILEPSEELLWTGQPRQGLLFQPSDLWLFPFAVLWFGFVAWLERSVPSADATDSYLFAHLFVALMILTGLYVCVTRFFVEAKIRARTFYAVTSQRILINSGLIWCRTKSLDLKSMHDPALTERRDGSGTIVLGPTVSLGGWPQTQYWFFPSPPTLEMMPQVRTVYDLIIRTQQAAH